MPPKNVLFLCTGNSARSVLSEAILNQRGAGRFVAYSAGSHPSGHVRPEALAELRAAGIPTEGLRSKSWDEFAAPGALPMDFVFTVCDNAANETCPLWPGHPISAHWGVTDPAAVEGPPAEITHAFHEAFVTLHRRIVLFLALPMDTLDPTALQQAIQKIGRQ